MQKLYHSISDISHLIDEEPHILRYWEKEFDILKPRKNRSGNRIYSNKDLTIVKTIKKFLREEKLSLKGAKEKISLVEFAVEDDSNDQLDFQDVNELEQSETQTNKNSNENTSHENIKLKFQQELNQIRTALTEALDILKV